MRDSGRSLTVPSAGKATPRDDAIARRGALVRSAARRLTGDRRRLFQAEVATALCGGHPRLAERRFGWGRDTVATGRHERHSGIRCRENFAARPRRRSEEKDPQLAADIRAIVEPPTDADPELRSSRRYSNPSAAEVPDALVQKGQPRQGLPGERTLRDIPNRRNSRLKRIQKGQPLKKAEEADAIVANVEQVRGQAREETEALEIAVDAQAKVALGEYVRGGKNPDGLRR